MARKRKAPTTVPKPYVPNAAKLAKLDLGEHRRLASQLILELYSIATNPEASDDARIKAANSIPRCQTMAFDTDRHVGALRLEEYEAMLKKLEEKVASIHGASPKRMALPTTGAILRAVPRE